MQLRATSLSAGSSAIGAKQSSIAKMISAILRNNGTLLLPGAATPVLGGELRQNFAVGMTGTATAATYNTTTGVGSITRVDISNQSFVRLTGLTSSATYLMSVTNTGTANISVRQTNSAGAILVHITPGTTTPIFFTGDSTCLITAATGTNTFVINSFAQLQGYTHGNPALRNYLDSAGTDILDSVTQVDQPVGLCLDSMGVLGAELFGVTLNFADAAWTKTAAVTSSGANTFTTNGFGGCHAYVTAQGAKTYAVRVVGTSTVSATFRNAAGASGAFTIAAGAFDTTANSQLLLENGSLYIQLASAGTITITSISVREIPGNHATQPTTASKPILRRGLVNQLTQSDFQAGVTDAPTRGGLVTASTLTGYGGALAFGHDGSAISYGYKLFAATLSAAYTLAFVVKMDDGNAPVFGNVVNQDASNTFAVVMYGNAYNPIGAGGYTVTALADNTYLVTCSAVATTAVSANFGVVKYPTNNNRTFKVTRYGLFQGTVTAAQILAAGGVPLTTTAPASSARGNYWWQFDGSNDSLTTAITTGNEGWVCAGVTFTDSNSTVVCSGAGSNVQKGVWLYRTAADDRLNMLVGDGVITSLTGAVSTVTAGVPTVVSGGWTPTTQMLSVDNTETSKTRTNGDASPSPEKLRIGAYHDGTTYPANGSFSAKVYCTIYPSAADRALIRRFVGSLQGQTL